MIKDHSQTVARVPGLGMGEEEVFNGLWDKTEKIWQDIRLRATP